MYWQTLCQEFIKTQRNSLRLHLSVQHQSPQRTKPLPLHHLLPLHLSNLHILLLLPLLLLPPQRPPKCSNSPQPPLTARTPSAILTCAPLEERAQAITKTVRSTTMISNINWRETLPQRRRCSSHPPTTNHPWSKVTMTQTRTSGSKTSKTTSGTRCTAKPKGSRTMTKTTPTTPRTTIS